jgi:hypothetical protein
MPIKLPIITEYNPKGFKEANKGIAGLKKAIAGLAIGAAVFKVGQLGFEFAKMAQADKVSQDLMNASLKKTTHTTEAGMKANEAFIQTLSNQVGIIDDNLRPALAGLARVSGSTSKAQKLLQIALDASAMSGKPLEATSKAVAKAYAGNTTALKKMFPELANTETKFVSLHGKATTLAQKTNLARQMLADLGKEAAGQALIKATPFDKFNVAMDNMKEKLGALILPKLTDFMTTLMKPGGPFDQLSAFIDQVGNPKTDAGKAFKDMQKGVGDLATSIGGFLKLFTGDTMSGYLQFAKTLAQIAGLIGIAKTVAGILGFFGVASAGAVGAGVAGVAATQLAASEAASANAAQVKKQTGKNVLIQPGGVQALPGVSDWLMKTKSLPPAKIDITIHAGLGANGQDIGNAIVNELRKYSRKNGVSFANIIR